MQSNHEQPFELPQSWSDVLDSITSHTGTDEEDITTFSLLQCPVTIVKGPKKVGKSTLARTLLNRLTTAYRRVAFIECDIGQTEFTPPGMISLNILAQPVFGMTYSSEHYK